MSTTESTEPTGSEGSSKNECPHPDRRLVGHEELPPGFGKPDRRFYHCPDCKAEFHIDDAPKGPLVHEEAQEDPYKGLAGNCGTCGAKGTDEEPEEDAETASVPSWAIRDDLWRRIESEIYEWRERTALWGESDGITQSLADLARRAVEPVDIPRRPPIAVMYGVEGGHLYEALLSGDAAVAAEDGVLKIFHPDAAVLAVVRVVPVKGEADAPDSH